MTTPLSASGISARDVALKAAKEAGDILLHYFRRSDTVHHKGKRNLVSNADLASEEAIMALLRKEYPSHAILSEEAGHVPARSGYTWIIDPLDGTNNYIFGIPWFCVTIALTRGPDILLGLTYDPLRKEAFLAEKGRGAELNGKPVAVSNRTSIYHAILGYDMGYNPEKGKETVGVVSRLWPRAHGFRAMGSAALGIASVGCGRLDLYFHKYLYPWDIASGILFVREAGGQVTDWSGKAAGYRNRAIIASSKTLGQEFLGLVR